MKPGYRSSFLPLVTLVLATYLGCGTESPYPADVARVLESAGSNSPELEQVLNHYLTEGDSLSYEAACFLIGNMQGHSFVEYYLHDSGGTEIDFDVLDYPDYDALLVSVDSIESERGEMDYDKRDAINDLEVIRADYLIEQIDFSFRAWRERPWARGLSFEQFKQYVLPYRGSNEPLERWRENFMEKYSHIAEEMTDSSDAIEAATLINNDIMTWFGFDPRFYYHPTDQSLSQMITNGLGRCEDMTNVTIYAMRANGLAVTSDYTPHWANSGNNHAWNAIVSPDGEVIPFMGAEANPRSYRLANKLAKAYRKTFSQQKNNLIFQENRQKEIPRWLARKSYLDVTADYVDAVNITVPLDNIPDSVDFAYLCVFNSGEWKAIHWGKIEADAYVTFSDMGPDIAYLPAYYLNEEITPAGPPFVAYQDGAIEACVSDSTSSKTLRLNSTTKRKQEVSTDGIARTYLTVGQEYELFYWSDGWISAGTATAGEALLTFAKVPGGCLYWLVADDSDREERIFTYEGNQQIWW